MSKKDFIVGLDIGTTKVCCIVGEIVDASPQPVIDIVGIGTAPSAGMRKGVVVNIDSTVESISKAVEEAELMAGVEITHVHAGIAGGHVKSFNSTGVVAIKDKEITDHDVKRVIDAAKAVAIPADREVIHVIPQEFIIDEQDGIRDPIGMSGVRLEAKVHIVTASSTSAQNIIKCANKAGLTVSDLCLEQIASAEAVLSDDEKELGIALVDIGGGTSDIAIYKEGSLLYTGVLPIGGNHITNDIAVGLRTPQYEAEKIKVQYGAAIPEAIRPDETIEVPGVGGRKSRVLSKRLLAEIIAPRVEEIFLMIQKEIAQSGYRDMMSAGIVLTGGATLMDGLTELAEQIFEMPAKRGVPYNVGGLKDVVHSPQFSTGVGLLRYGTKNMIKQRTPMMDKFFIGSIRGSMRSWIKDLF